MTETTKPKFTWKDGVYIASFVILIAGWINTRGNLIAEQALQADQVKRNTLVLETYNLPVIDYKMAEMDKKLDEVLELLKQ